LVYVTKTLNREGIGAGEDSKTKKSGAGPGKSILKKRQKIRMGRWLRGIKGYKMGGAEKNPSQGKKKKKVKGEGTHR